MRLYIICYLPLPHVVRTVFLNAGITRGRYIVCKE